MRRALAFVLLAACGPAVAQEVAIPEVIYPKLVGEAPSAAGFVPKGWKLERQQSGEKPPAVAPPQRRATN